MPQLLLDSLHIQGFRAFRDLRIPRLGRVNLIVGKNNSGKSSVLEALRLYVTEGMPTTIEALLAAREETAPSAVINPTANERPAVEYLFHGRQPMSDAVRPSASVKSVMHHIHSKSPSPGMLGTPMRRQALNTDSHSSLWVKACRQTHLLVFGDDWEVPQEPTWTWINQDD
jgi:hypothetical protein